MKLRIIEGQLKQEKDQGKNLDRKGNPEVEFK